jgi:hypothetical protein
MTADPEQGSRRADDVLRSADGQAIATIVGSERIAERSRARPVVERRATCSVLGRGWTWSGCARGSLM